MARDRLEKEMNIIELIKSQRYFARALKSLIPREKRLQLREQTRYLVVDPDEEDEGSSPPANKREQYYAADIEGPRLEELSSGHFSDSSISSKVDVKFMEDNCSNSIKAVNELIRLDSRQTSSRPLQESPIEEKEAAAKDAGEAGSLTLP